MQKPDELKRDPGTPPADDEQLETPPETPEVTEPQDGALAD